MALIHKELQADYGTGLNRSVQMLNKGNRLPLTLRSALILYGIGPFFSPFRCIVINSNAYHQIYDPDVIPLLLSAIQDLFKNHGIKQFVISATLRNRATFEMFLHGCGT